MTQEASFKPSLDKPSGQGPLRRFRGRLQSWEAVDKTADNDGRSRTYKQIQFKIMELDVLEATEPYPFPQAAINLTYSPPDSARGPSRWEAFASSLRTLSPTNPDLDILVDKVSEWAMLPFTLRTPKDVVDEETGLTKQVWGPEEVDCWQVVDIEGLAKPEDLTELIIGLADGKTEVEFNQALLTNAQITPRVDIVTSITERKLLPALLAGGRLTQDNEGVLHKAGG